MLCLRCGNEAGFNRAVVERTSNTCIGGLCIQCEEQAFGAVLQSTERMGTSCSLCSRHGGHALPEWLPYTDRAADGSLVVRVEYDVDAETIHLCDRHLRLVASEHLPSRTHTVNISVRRGHR